MSWIKVAYIYIYIYIYICVCVCERERERGGERERERETEVGGREDFNESQISFFFSPIILPQLFSNARLVLGHVIFLNIHVSGIHVYLLHF